MKAFMDDTQGAPFKTIWSYHAPFVVTLSMTIPMQLIAAVLYCVFFGIQGIQEWEYKTKPVPMVLIILTACAFVSFYGTNLLHTCVTLGFVLSLAGDVILMSESPEQFLLGLAVFLVAHIFYIVAFSIPPKRTKPRVGFHWKRAIPFAIMFAVVPHIITAKMRAMEDPNEIMIFAVYVYGLVLAVMGWRAAARVGYPAETYVSQIIALIGAIFFMSSDLMLALNKFHTPLPYAQVWVLSTYWIGQTAIAISLQRVPWDRKPHQVENL